MFSLLGLNFSAEQELKFAYEYHYHDYTATVSDWQTKRSIDQSDYAAQ